MRRASSCASGERGARGVVVGVGSGFCNRGSLWVRQVRRSTSCKQWRLVTSNLRLSLEDCLPIRRGRCFGDSSCWSEEEGGGAEAVGAIGEDVGGAEAVDDDWAGMAEGVVLTVRDDGVDGRDGCEELWRGGGVAAVVADFE